MAVELQPDRLQQLGASFRASRAFLSAVELGVFSALATGPLDAGALAERTGVHAAAARDFFDALVALGVLCRRGHLYSNSAATFPWQRYETIVDLGTAEGCLPVHVALAHPHLHGGGFDLPAVAPFFDEFVAAAGLGSRLRFYAGDLLVDDLPQVDVFVMGNLLCDFDLETKMALLAKARSNLAPGGSLIVYESLIDDERRQNCSALLTSIAMRLQKEGAFGYTGAECQEWMRQVGYVETRVERLEGPRSMVIATT